MPYPDDLLTAARNAIHLQAATQADLRRAVSTAYYAVFHLLISEAVAHWDLESSRPALARMFEHTLMKKVSRKIANPKDYQFAGQDPHTVARLRKVAEAFLTLQDERHTADYDTSIDWTSAEAIEEVERATETFATWQTIRHEKIAQDYLVALLIKPRD